MKMWISSLLRSPSRAHKNPPSNNYRCSSFRDVHVLFSDDDDFTGSPSPRPPNSPIHRSSLLTRIRISTSVLRALAASIRHNNGHHHPHPPPDAYNRVVVYYTSLRIVRRTYEDCRTVRSILKSFKVKIDERDLSMDSSFIEELQKIGPPMTLPMVFIDGRYIGGAEEIRTVHENGDLKRMIERLPINEPDGVCTVCGGHRFMLCDWCRGSHKVFTEEHGGFRICDECNQNGLIKCPTCTSVFF